MQQTTGVAVLATELPATDRRALSQAWYSALHLAERDAPRCAGRARTARGTAADTARLRDAADTEANATARDGRRGSAAVRGRRAASSAVKHADVTPGHRERWAAIPTPGAHAVERRGAAGPLGRALNDAMLRHAAGGRVAGRGSASFTVSAGAERVHVLVRSDRGRTHVVALCAPTVRERVERALAHARFALAARGVRAEAA